MLGSNAHLPKIAKPPDPLDPFAPVEDPEALSKEVDMAFTQIVQPKAPAVAPAAPPPEETIETRKRVGDSTGQNLNAAQFGLAVDEQLSGNHYQTLPPPSALSTEDKPASATRAKYDPLSELMAEPVLDTATNRQREAAAQQATPNSVPGTAPATPLTGAHPGFFENMLKFASYSAALAQNAPPPQPTPSESPSPPAPDTHRRHHSSHDNQSRSIHATRIRLANSRST